MASRLLRRQVMTLTDAAAARVRELTEAAGKPVAGLRVGIKNGGCAGMSYTMELAESAAPTDEVVEDKGVRLLIDPKAVLFLLGSQMDFKVDRLSATFAFSNPNETSACGCGESVAITPVSPEALQRAGLIFLHERRGLEGTLQAVWRSRGQAHVWRRGHLCRRPVLRHRAGRRSLPQGRRALSTRLYRRGLFALHLRRQRQADADLLLALARDRPRRGRRTCPLGDPWA